MDSPANLNLTNNKILANIITDTKGVVFLCLIIGFLVGAKSVTASLVSTERSPFFIGETMPAGVYKRPIKQWREDNKEYLAKWHKKHRQDHKEERAEYYEQWRKDNPNYMKQYREEHKKEASEYIKRWYKDNREYVKKYKQDNKKYIAKWRKQYNQTPTRKMSMKASDHNRRILKKELTKETIQQVYKDNIKKYGVLTCCLCFKPIIKNDKGLRDSLEHLTPLSRGGSNNYKNLGVAHLVCNLKKHTMTLREYKNVIKIRRDL